MRGPPPGRRELLSPARPAKKRRGRLYRRFERIVLGAGMSLVALIVERRLIKAIKKGGMKPAPRTAAGSNEVAGDQALAEPPRQAQLAASKQVGNQAEG